MLSISAQSDLVPTVGATTYSFSDTAEGVFVLSVDISLMQAGDTFIMDILRKVRSTGVGTTEVVVATSTITGAAASPFIKELGPLIAPFGATARLRQSAGTSRTFPFTFTRSS